MDEETEVEGEPKPPESVKTLTQAAKIRVVQELACFTKVAEIRKILASEYGITDVKPEYLYFFDASKSYCVTGAPLRELFHKTREKFIKGGTDLFISQQGYRLRVLQRMAQKAEDQGQLKLAADLLKQAAEEIGGLYTNIRQLEANMNHSHTMSVDEARAKVAEAQRRIGDKKAAEATATIQ